MSEGYNGYSSYPTWNVGLWIDNDQSTSNYKDELVQQADSVGKLADALKDWITGDMPVLDEASMTSDILGWAMEQVNWHELAKLYWEEKEVDEDETEEDEEQ